MYRVRYKSSLESGLYRWLGTTKKEIVLVADPKDTIEYASIYETMHPDMISTFDDYVWDGIEKISQGEFLSRIANELSALWESDFNDRLYRGCLLYTSPSPRDRQKSRMPSSA